MIVVPERALTVRQPYAWAIAESLKPLENRDWPPPKGIIGQRIALHSSKARVDVDDWEHVLELAASAPEPDSDLFVKGALIAVMKVKAFVDKRGSKTLPRHEYKWFVGDYGWLLVDVVKLGEPIKATGQLGVWKLLPHTRAALKAQLEIDAATFRAVDHEARAGGPA